MIWMIYLQTYLYIFYSLLIWESRRIHFARSVVSLNTIIVVKNLLNALLIIIKKHLQVSRWQLKLY